MPCAAKNLSTPAVLYIYHFNITHTGQKDTIVYIFSTLWQLHFSENSLQIFLLSEFDPLLFEIVFLL